MRDEALRRAPRSSRARGLAVAAALGLLGSALAAACASSDSVDTGSSNVTSGAGASGPTGSGSGGNGGGGLTTSTTTTSSSSGGGKGGGGQGGSGQGGAGQGGAGQGGASTGQGGAGQGGANAGGAGGGDVDAGDAGDASDASDAGNCADNMETCNGLDDNCNGQVDENDPGGGMPCVANGFGECKKGTLHCVNGAVKCVAAQPTPEVCDGLDNNCDGNVDEGNPGGGNQCQTGFMGLCAGGITTCDGVNGDICKPNVTPNQLPESCNGLDDDCNGLVDDNISQVGQPCTAPGYVGICQFGTYTCPNQPPYQLTCNHPAPGTIQETCNAKDDDCNGVIDDPAQLNGQPCGTGLSGVCSTGKSLCSGGSSTCVPDVAPGSQTEICDNKDNDCNGQTDEMNPTPACTTQNPAATGVKNWACTSGACQIATCNLGFADIDGAPGNGCECATDQWANVCSNASTLSVPKGTTAVTPVAMEGKIETANGSDYVVFSFPAPPIPQVWHPKIQLANNGANQFAMDVMNDCNGVYKCNDNGTGTNATTWELNYNGYGSPASDNDAKPSSVVVRVYRKNADTPTCDKYRVEASNP